jgi:hypothetical protein
MSRSRVTRDLAIFRAKAIDLFDNRVTCRSPEANADCGPRHNLVIRGLGAAPVDATVLMVAALSLAEVPPFSIFASELMALRAGIGQDHWVAIRDL